MRYKVLAYLQRRDHVEEVDLNADEQHSSIVTTKSVSVKDSDA